MTQIDLMIKTRYTTVLMLSTYSYKNFRFHIYSFILEKYH